MTISFFLEPSVEVVPEYARFTDRTLWRIWSKREEKPNQKTTYSKLVFSGILDIGNAANRYIEDGCFEMANTNQTFRHEMRTIFNEKCMMAAFCIASGLHREVPQGREFTPLSENMSGKDLALALEQYSDHFYSHYAAWELSDPHVARVWLDRFLNGFFCRLMLSVRQQLMRWKLWGGSALVVVTEAFWSPVEDTPVIFMKPRNGILDGQHLKILPSMIRDSVLPEIDTVPLIRLPPHKLLAKWGAPQAALDDVEWLATVSQT